MARTDLNTDCTNLGWLTHEVETRTDLTYLQWQITELTAALAALDDRVVVLETP